MVWQLIRNHKDIFNIGPGPGLGHVLVFRVLVGGWTGLGGSVGDSQSSKTLVCFNVFKLSFALYPEPVATVSQRLRKL